MSVPADVVVVGASAAGLATAEALRRKGYQGGLTVLGAEPHLPYDRPPLSKQVLSGAWAPDRARLRPREALSALGAEFLLGDPAVGLDVERRAVHTASGRTLRAGAVVVATGLRPRTLPGQAGLAGVHVLRTLDDALALRADLRADLRDPARLVVVGDGVLGAEIAATACELGAAVTLAGPEPAPLAGRLGPMIAGLLADLHAERGVRLRPGAGVSGLDGHDGRVTGVRLGTGEVLPADVVVVAIGAVPETGWLAGTLIRLENRTNATEQGGLVASCILGDDRPYRPVPYFWTDQFDARIHVHGTPSAGAEPTVVDGDPAERRFVALYHRNATITGVLGWNMPKQARLWRGRIGDAVTGLAPAL